MNKDLVQEKEVVLEAFNQKRLDVYSSEIFDITRSNAQKLIKEGSVLVNDAKVSSKYLVKTGDVVCWIKNDKIAEIPKVPVIFEDEDFFVVDKPAGISVHPSIADKDITLTELYSEKINDPEQSDRPGVVHRLDKGTSGVLLIAKNPESRKYLQKQFKLRKVRKKYLALIDGRLEPSQGEIDIPISRDMKNRSKMAAVSDGKQAKTEYKVLEFIDSCSFVEANPLTGRTHQIRVHFSAIGHPVVGDVRYGKKSEFLNRIFLHAASIEFFHPKTNKLVSYESKLPDELNRVLEEIRNRS